MVPSLILLDWTIKHCTSTLIVYSQMGNLQFLYVKKILWIIQIVGPIVKISNNKISWVMTFFFFCSQQSRLTCLLSVKNCIYSTAFNKICLRCDRQIFFYNLYKNCILSQIIVSEMFVNLTWLVIGALNRSLLEI